MLPYLSYLRVYEPVAVLPEPVRRMVADDEPGLVDSGGLALAGEQETVLTRAVVSGDLSLDADHAPRPYVLRRDGRLFGCPVDMPLRSWLSLTSIVDSIGDTTVNLLISPRTMAMADEAFLRWRRDHPRAVPHIRQSTWGVPRTWFVAFVAEERERYTTLGALSLRYRTSVTDGRRRLATAHGLLSRIIDDSELLEDLVDLAGWLEAFDEQSWVELDYAGVAQLLGPALDGDESAREIHRTLTALRKRDFALAGATYRTFEERWRSVSSYERAN